MMSSLTVHLARPLSIRRCLHTLARLSTQVLVIAPSTRGAITFAQALVRTRPCIVTRGPVTASFAWAAENCLRTAAEISHALTGLPTMPQTVISFPDQLPSTTSTCVMVPFLGQPHALSTLEALLVLRHRPRVFALTTFARQWGFRLTEVRYDDAFDPDGRLISLGCLVARLLQVLGRDLSRPPADWLGQPYLAQKSERVLWLQAREEMKDIECLLRMQLQSRFCDRDRTTAALDAVVERQRILVGSALP